MTPIEWFVTVGLVVLVAVGIYDVHLARKYGWNGTISYWMYVNSVKYPIIPASISFAVGTCIGHWFWNWQTVIELVVFVLFGHFWWDQVLNVSVTIGNSDPQAKQ